MYKNFINNIDIGFIICKNDNSDVYNSLLNKNLTTLEKLNLYNDYCRKGLTSFIGNNELDIIDIYKYYGFIIPCDKSGTKFDVQLDPIVELSGLIELAKKNDSQLFDIFHTFMLSSIHVFNEYNDIEDILSKRKNIIDFILEQYINLLTRKNERYLYLVNGIINHNMYKINNMLINDSVKLLCSRYCTLASLIEYTDPEDKGEISDIILGIIFS